MTHLLAGELLKVRTTRTAFGFAIAALLLALATVLIVSLAGGGPETIRDKRAAIAFGSVISAVLLIYGVVGATGEFRHRTLAPAVLIAPDRYRLVIARMLAYGLTAGLAAAAIGAVVYLIGIPLLAGTAARPRRRRLPRGRRRRHASRRFCVPCWEWRSARSCATRSERWWGCSSGSS